MADSSMETMVATSLSILATCASAAALLMAMREPQQPSILIYDPDVVAEQVTPYTDAGQDPLAVLDAAVQEAVARGYIVVDARIEIAGPASALLQLEDFVEVGGEVGKDHLARTLGNLPGTVPVVPGTEPDQTAPVLAERAPAAASQIGSDVEDFARQLMGNSGAFTPATPSN